MVREGKKVADPCNIIYYIKKKEYSITVSEGILI